MTLGDKARGWFDGPGRAWRAALPVAERTAVATESLAMTARLMAVMAWVLDPAQDSGEAGAAAGHRSGGRRPGAGVLHGQAGGDIALASRQLVARAEALATG